ncbi:MAG: GNAT family N-acetyltransferase [Faecalibacterium sp.]|nr:GNAT family N-acetyltransferase [Faecalibacterium sp.]
MLLTTARLTLAPQGPQLLHTAHRYCTDPETTRYMFHLPNETEAETLQALLAAQQEWETPHPQRFEFAVFRAGGHIGAVSVARDGELGYILDKYHWGQGYAAEAARAVLDWCRTTQGMTEFMAHCDAENHASRRVLEKLGFVFTEQYGGRRNRGSTEDRQECLYTLACSE